MQHALVAIAAAIVACSSPPRDAPTMSRDAAAILRPRIVAHRGASFDAPENTLAAFRRAWELGVEAIELDVHVTRDQAVVVIHDATTKRVTGVDRPVAELTLADVRALDAGSWKSPRFAGERIPTLAEVFATTPAGRTVFVEIKSPAATVPAVAAAIRARPATVQVALQGYDAATLRALSAELPGIAAYWTVDPPTEGSGDSLRALPYPAALVDEAREHGFAGVALYHGAVDAGLIARLRAAALAVDVWTINEADAIATWIARSDVRWLETDRPDLAAAR